MGGHCLRRHARMSIWMIDPSYRCCCLRCEVRSLLKCWFGLLGIDPSPAEDRVDFLWLEVELFRNNFPFLTLTRSLYKVVISYEKQHFNTCFEIMVSSSICSTSVLTNNPTQSSPFAISKLFGARASIGID